MADHCLKTKTCRIFNAPSEARRNALTMQVGVGAVVQFVMTLLIKQNAASKEMAEGVDSALTALFPDLGKLQCAQRYIEDICAKVADVLLKLWPADKETNAIHMLSVAGALVIQMREDMKPFWAEHPDYAAPSIWQGIEDGIDKIFEFFNEDLSEDYIYADRVPKAVERLQAVIWPAQPLAKEVTLRLFLVNDLYWVAAEERSQAKSIVQREHKCKIVTVESIQLHETFEDGTTAANLLEMAKGKPRIMGKTS